MTNDAIYDNYEISGCHRFDETGKPDSQGNIVETCDDVEADFWTLYGHIDGQGVEAIADFRSRATAEEVYYRITGERFAGSLKANPRLCLMHAAPTLLAALESIVDYAESEAYSLESLKDSCESEAEAKRAWKAVERANAAIALTRADTTFRVGLWPYSVLLRYPKYINEDSTEPSFYYTHVEARDPDDAVAVARREAADDEEITCEPDDIVPLLVTRGHNRSIPACGK